MPKRENAKICNRRDAERRKHRKTAIGMTPKGKNAKSWNRRDAERQKHKKQSARCRNKKPKTVIGVTPKLIYSNSTYVFPKPPSSGEA